MEGKARYVPASHMAIVAGLAALTEAPTCPPPSGDMPKGKPFRGRVVGHAPIEAKEGSKDRTFRGKKR